MIESIHHIAFVVEDLDIAVQFYQDKLGLQLKDRTYFLPRGIEVALFDVNGVLIELIHPIEEGTRPYTFLQENGEGFFHIAFQVSSIEDSINRLEQKQVQMLDKKSIQGIDWDVAWLRKDETMGVFMQLVK